MMAASVTDDKLGTVDLNEPENGLSAEEKQKQDEALLRELQETESEIETLKTVLNNKVKRANEIKRKLGISVWSEMRDSAKSGLSDIKDSNAYKSTVQAAQTAKEKTTEVFTSAKEKLTSVSTADAFKSFGEKVGSAYTSVKDKLKVGAPATEASASETTPISGPSTLEEAITADKNDAKTGQK